MGVLTSSVCTAEAGGVVWQASVMKCFAEGDIPCHQSAHLRKLQEEFFLRVFCLQECASFAQASFLWLQLRSHSRSH
jgi:hypothetical protein